MSKIWKLLNKEEIKALSEKELKSYLQWLKKQKSAKQDDLAMRKAVLNKLVDFKEREKFAKKESEDKEELARIRQELNT